MQPVRWGKEKQKHQDMCWDLGLGTDISWRFLVQMSLATEPNEDFH